MKYFRLLCMPILAVVLLFAVTAAGPGPVDIKLRPVKGILGKYEIRTTVDVKSKYQGKDMNFGMNMLLRSDISAAEPSGDTVFIDIVYKAMNIRINSMGNVIAVDTDHPQDENDVFYQVYRCMIGRPIRVGFSQRGDVLKISGIDAIYQAMRDSADSNDPETQEKLIASIKGVLSEEKLRQDLSSSMRFMPPKILVSGEKWKSQHRTMNNGMQIVMEDVFRFNGTQNNLYQISMTGKVASDKAPVTMANGAVSTYLLKGTETASFRVNAGNGWLEEMEMTMFMKGKAITQAEGQKLVILMEVKSSGAQRRLAD